MDDAFMLVILIGVFMLLMLIGASIVYLTKILRHGTGHLLQERRNDRIRNNRYR